MFVDPIQVHNDYANSVCTNVQDVKEKETMELTTTTREWRRKKQPLKESNHYLPCQEIPRFGWNFFSFLSYSIFHALLSMLAVHCTEYSTFIHSILLAIKGWGTINCAKSFFPAISSFWQGKKHIRFASLVVVVCCIVLFWLYRYMCKIWMWVDGTMKYGRVFCKL